MNPALLRILLAAAGKSIEQGTLVEIVETAARLLALVKPLIADSEPATSRQDPSRAAEGRGR